MSAARLSNREDLARWRQKRGDDLRRLGLAEASRTVLYAMAGVMAVAFVVSLAAMPAGKVEDPEEQSTPNP